MNVSGTELIEIVQTKRRHKQIFLVDLKIDVDITNIAPSFLRRLFSEFDTFTVTETSTSIRATVHSLF